MQSARPGHAGAGVLLILPERLRGRAVCGKLKAEKTRWRERL